MTKPHPPNVLLMEDSLEDAEPSTRELKMPKVDGLKLLETLRSEPQTKTVPVIELPLSNDDSGPVRAYELGVSSYVGMPTHFDEFSEAVQQLEIYLLQYNEVARR